MRKHLYDRHTMWTVALLLIVVAVTPTAMLLVGSIVCSIWCVTLPSTEDVTNEGSS